MLDQKVASCSSRLTRVTCWWSVRALEYSFSCTGLRYLMVENVCLTDGLVQGSKKGATSSRSAHRVETLMVHKVLPYVPIREFEP